MYKDDKYVKFFKEILWPSPVAEKWTAILVDRLRLLVLRDHGGVFTDIDVKFVRSFEDVLMKEMSLDTTFFAGLRRLDGEAPMLEVSTSFTKTHAASLTEHAYNL
jgi:hypothetical protein